MNIPSLTWRDVLNAVAALLSLTSSLMWLHERWRDHRDKRRRAAEHRRAVAEIAPEVDLDPDTTDPRGSGAQHDDARDTDGEDDQS